MKLWGCFSKGCQSDWHEKWCGFLGDAMELSWTALLFSPSSKQIKCSNIADWSFSGRILRHVGYLLSCVRFNIPVYKFWVYRSAGQTWFLGHVEGFRLDFCFLSTETVLKLGLLRSLQVSPWPGLTPLCRFLILLRSVSVYANKTDETA